MVYRFKKDKGEKRMARCLALLAFFVLCPLMDASAVPAKPGRWQTITLADGTTVSVQLRGDEFGHAYYDADGNCYKKQNGSYVAADVDSMQAASIEHRSRRKPIAASGETVRRRAVSSSTSDGLGSYGQSASGAVNTIGECTIPVVMVNYSDVTFQSTTTVEYMNRFYNEEGFSDESLAARGAVFRGSVRDYFRSQSNGMFSPTFDVVGIVTLNHPCAYYGENDKEGWEPRIDSLPKHAVEAAVAQLRIDFTKYEVNGAVPLVAVLYAGEGEATNGDEDTVWPCEWECDADYAGVHFNSCFVGNELVTVNETSLSGSGYVLAGMGTFCHEFGHALGLPDFYDTYGNSHSSQPFSYWSIMDYGSYLNDSYAPMGYTAYERSYLGWLEIPEIDLSKETEETLVPPGEDGNNALLIRNSNNEKQYFILENRYPGTWYPDDLGSGLMLTRIAYSSYYWESNILNNQTEQRAKMITADGSKLKYTADEENLYGNGKNLQVSWDFYDGSTAVYAITDITKNSDGTISFKGTPQSSFAFYESFNGCSGAGGNDNQWSGRTVATSTFTADNDGWTADKKGGSACARFGSSSGSSVSVVSPKFYGGETAAVYFLAGAWNSSKDGTSLALSASNGTLTSTDFTMERGAWNTYSTVLSASDSTALTFSTAGRFFLDEVLVIPQSTSGIRQTEVETPSSEAVYNLGGQRVGTSLSGLPAGIYIRNGRKYVVR